MTVDEQEVERVLLEDLERSRELRAEYDPITGEGGIGVREWLEIKDCAIPRQYAPVEMIHTGLIQQILQAGSIERFVRKLNRETGITTPKNGCSRRLSSSGSSMTSSSGPISRYT